MNQQHAALDVLLIEDEFLIRWAIAHTLASAGHRVVEAADAESAITMLARMGGHPDVVLLDYRLPDTDGLSLFATIRQLAPESAVVLMTADATPDALRAVDLGAAGIMQKPFDMADVEPALVSAVGKA
jgi:two-component system, NtrC family, C4-dicarboxylate transport response regulator DctD